MPFVTAVLTNSGGRSINQDSTEFSVTESMACWVLADGLGGHGGGEHASQIATKTVIEAFNANPSCTPAALLAYLQHANDAVVQKQADDASLSGMRTTIVVVASDSQTASWAHVGDSRLYYFKQGILHARTQDHSVPQAMVNAGQLQSKEIRFHEDRNRLLRSIGGKEELRATIEEQPMKITPGDAFLLASDGFWEYVTETAMEVDLAKSAAPADWLRFLHLRLRDAAPPEQDNYTALAIFASL